MRNALPAALALCLFLAGCPKDRDRPGSEPTLVTREEPTPAPAATPRLPATGEQPVAARRPPRSVRDSWNEAFSRIARGAIQRELAENGFPAGPADGTWKPETEDALRNFQRERELPVTGVPDRLTLQSLFGTPESPPDLQLVRGEDRPPPVERPVTGRAATFGGGLGAGLLLAIVLLSRRR